MTDRGASTLFSREPAVGSWVSIGHSAVAEIAAKIGFDFAVIDIEHTPTSLETVQGMIHAIESTEHETRPIVRVPWNDPVRIKRVLDTGTAGIMVPMVETPDEAEMAVAAMQYPPEGDRGIAGSRATGYGMEFEEYVATADEKVITIAQIETRKAVENAGSIASVEGIDALFVGPADLSGSLGVFAQWDDSEFTESVEHVVETAHDTGVPVGTLALREADIEARVKQGFDFMVVGKDTKYIVDGSTEAKNLYQQLTAE